MAAVDDSLINAFEQDEFVVVEDFFDSKELKLFGSIVDQAAKDRIRRVALVLCVSKIYDQSFMTLGISYVP